MTAPPANAVGALRFGGIVAGMAAPGAVFCEP